MVNRFLASLFFFLVAGLLLAQDMPPLPPMQDQAAPAGSNNSAALPPLPGEPAPSAGSAQALPPVPGEAAPSTGSAQALPPVPGEAAPSNDQALPPVPGEKTPKTDSAQAASAASPAPEAAPAVSKKASTTHSKHLKPWQISKWRPNVIYGGWVNAKGGNESSKLAWTSQEVLNALEFKGYRAKEEGRYDGQDQKQWRKFTFRIPKSKSKDEPVVVYVRQVGKKIWVRVGPDEAPPTGTFNLSKVKKMKQADLKALHFIQKKFGRRMSPNRIVRSWDAPYSYAAATADR